MKWIIKQIEYKDGMKIPWKWRHTTSIRVFFRNLFKIKNLSHQKQKNCTENMHFSYLIIEFHVGWYFRVHYKFADVEYYCVLFAVEQGLCVYARDTELTNHTNKSVGLLFGIELKCEKKNCERINSHHFW